MPAIDMVATSIQYCATGGLTTWVCAPALPPAASAAHARAKGATRARRAGKDENLVFMIKLRKVVEAGDGKTASLPPGICGRY